VATSSSSSIAVAVDDDGGGGEDAEELTTLRRENELLHERLKLLQIQNDRLLKRQRETDDTESPPEEIEKRTVTIERRLILEDFEGEGMLSVDARGGAVDGWSKSERRYTEPWDDDDNDDDGGTSEGGGEDYEDELGLAELPEDEVCEYDDETDKWTAGGVGECPVEPALTFVDALKSRANWLVGLLALQSCSGFILSRNELLLQDHPVIVYFLTMLVGAGGNAGNQASVRVIRGLALGTLNPRTQGRFLNREFRMAVALSGILSAAGFVRAVVFGTPLPETLAVTLALSMIVFSSICLGAVLPLVLQRAGVDPAHSSTTIQVIMDILGVVLTVFVSTMVLDSGWGKTLIKVLGHMGL